MAEELFKTNGSTPAKPATAPKPEPTPAPAPAGNSDTPKVEDPAKLAAQTGQAPGEPAKAAEVVAGVDALGSPAPAALTPSAPNQGEPAAPINTVVVVGGNATTSPTTTGENLLTEDEATDPDNEDEEIINEIDFLKNRAKIMGIPFSNNIGVDALRKKIADKLSGSAAEVEEQEQEEILKTSHKDENVTGENAETATLNPLNMANTPKGKKLNLRQHLQMEKMKLVRLRITNLDPKKKDLNGEIFTVANEFLGTVRKFIPFGEVTDNGYHVPYCLYEQLRDRKFLNLKTRKAGHGTTEVDQQWVKEFALEVLPPLTSAEMARLGAAQLAREGIEN